MTNNQLMEILAATSKHKDQRKSIYLFGTLSLVSLVVAVVLYSKLQSSRRLIIEVKRQNHSILEQAALKNKKIQQQESAIKKLVHERSIKANEKLPPSPDISPDV